jgi:hypothetical protein
LAVVLFRNPKALGAAAVSVLALGSVALYLAPSLKRYSSAVLAWKSPGTSSLAFGPNTTPLGLMR